MARRSTSSAGSFHPPNDPATYRDLLLFEERLKTTAASLQRRKSRYQLFLLHLVFVIIFLLSEVVLRTSFLDVPYTYLLRSKNVKPHPYFASGLLLVAITTLLLFFASGMYAEKIAYANRYVPHANKALRSLNMYLNVRKPPLRSTFSLNPLSLVFPRQSDSSVPSPTLSRRSLSLTRASPSPTPTPSSPSSSHTPPTDRNTSVPIAPIPPTTNPRGELIFSSRVDRSFRESYERYRAAFERKRRERERSVAMQTWSGWLHYQMPWNRRLHPTSPQQQVGESQRMTSSTSSSTRISSSSSSSLSTPLSSRRSSPMTRASRRNTPALRSNKLVP